VRCACLDSRLYSVMGKALRHRLGRRRLVGAIALTCAAALLPSLALAHVERASYWPDPAPDTAVSPPAGGAVPAARSLFTALDPAPPGDTRVVCQGAVPTFPASKIAKARRNLDGRAERRKVRRLKRAYNRKVNHNSSIARLRTFVNRARANGYRFRPQGELQSFSEAEAEKLIAFNKRLLARCSFDSIQDPVTASGNNDRVVVMPGIYTEPKSRAAPTNDPKCDGLEEQNDRPGDGEDGLQTGANSYEYIATCPNDQNLIAVVGRAPGAVNGAPQPPLLDRHGIPNLGACVRCNLQLEGSGVSADDVIVDSGRVASANGGPAEPVKDVALRVDRADGFVFRQITLRHAREHGLYLHEVDGYRAEEFKAFHNEEYGVLTFTADHGLIQNCDAAGSGDAAIYPGSAADTGEETIEATERYNQEIRFCDMHHSSAGYSGTAANAVWLHHNDFYDNALGFTTDVFTAAGHPGFPQDSDLVENNDFFSNNLNPYEEGSDIVPTIPVPVGTAAWIAGGNNNTFRNNRIWDNWRRGVMLFAVPDAFVCGDSPTAGGNQQHGCDPAEVHTSFRNEFHHNVMGVAPGGAADPNGTDWWWDQFVGNTENCWYDNTGPDGTRSSLTADPPLNPAAGTSVPGFLPEDCPTSVGTGGDNDAELLSCLANFDEGAPTPCDWFTTPTEPQP